MRDQRGWRLAQAYHTARLSLTDPKHFPPTLEAFMDGGKETVDPRNEVAQMMLARLQQLNERNQQRAGGSE